MISANEVIACKRIQVTQDESGIMEFSLSTEIFCPDFKSVTVVVSTPRLNDELILTESTVRIFGSDMSEVPVPKSWSPGGELEKTLIIFIRMVALGAPVVKAASEIRTEMAISKVKRNIDLAADFIARTLFYCMKGLSDDDIDRARVSVIDSITEKIIQHRKVACQKTKSEAAR
jgi:hypothetical protein